MCKVISINTNKIKKVKQHIETHGSMLLSDVIKKYGQNTLGELLAVDEDIQLISDGGLLKMK